MVMQNMCFISSVGGKVLRNLRNKITWFSWYQVTSKVTHYLKEEERRMFYIKTSKQALPIFKK